MRLRGKPHRIVLRRGPVCDFDPTTDPGGRHGVCRKGETPCQAGADGDDGCDGGSVCQFSGVGGNGEALSGFCQRVPLAGLHMRCGGLGKAACAPGLICFRDAHTLPAIGGSCLLPSELPTACAFAAPGQTCNAQCVCF